MNSARSSRSRPISIVLLTVVAVLSGCSTGPSSVDGGLETANFCESIFGEMEDLGYTDLSDTDLEALDGTDSGRIPDDMLDDMMNDDIIQVEDRDIVSCERPFYDSGGNGETVAWALIGGEDYLQSSVSSSWTNSNSDWTPGGAPALSVCDESETEQEYLASSPEYFSEAVTEFQEEQIVLQGQYSLSVDYADELLESASSIRRDNVTGLCNYLGVFPNPVPSEWESEISYPGVVNCRICGDEFVVASADWIAFTSDIGDSLSPNISTASTLALLRAVTPLVAELPPPTPAQNPAEEPE